MNKPIYLLPFLYFYKAVRFVFVFLVKFIKFFSVGIFTVTTGFISVMVSSIIFIFKYFFKGLLFICQCLYNIVRYFIIGITAPFVFLSNTIKEAIKNNEIIKQKKALEAEKKAIAREHNRQIQEENKKRLLQKKLEEKQKREQTKAESAKRTQADSYVNEEFKFEKKSIFDKINDSFMEKKTKKTKKVKDINKEALLLDLEGKDAEKSEKKVMYAYVAKTEKGKIEKGTFAAYSKVEVHSFLLSEGKEVYSIKTNKWIQALYGDGSKINFKKIKTGDLVFFITQLSTYIKAGIPLVESLKILSNQFKNPTYRQIFRNMIYELSTGDNFSDAMIKQGNAFPRLLINMVKASEMTGELPEALDDMTDYYTETEKTRKQMITALTYPTIVFLFSVVVLIFVMVYVVPNFVNLYAGLDDTELPGITIAILNLSNFIQTQYVLIIAVTTLVIGGTIFLYKKLKAFKMMMQWVFMHVPVLGKVIIYNEVTMFTKTFASLLSHNVFITDSMDILNKITNNEIFRLLIVDTIANLAKGDKISLAYEDHWAFPIPAYEMIKTGEQTGQLPEMMSKVAIYYQDLHQNMVARIKTLVEPILIVFLTVVVGTIVVSIILPMFDVYANLV